MGDRLGYPPIRNVIFTSMAPLVNLAGQRIGRLLVVARSGDGMPVRWSCRCDCGREKIVRAFCLRQGFTKSCGCLNREMAAERGRFQHRTHGMHKSIEHASWSGMLARCRAPTNKDFKNYGGRGVTVCERWLKFEHFFADLGPRPTPQHSLDRIDVNGHYDPSNCRWATRSQQQRNKRPNTVVRRGNHLLTYKGKTQSIAGWAEEMCLTWAAIDARIRAGWPVESALTLPLGSRLLDYA